MLRCRELELAEEEGVLIWTPERLMGNSQLRVSRSPEPHRLLISLSISFATLSAETVSYRNKSKTLLNCTSVAISLPFSPFLVSPRPLCRCWMIRNNSTTRNPVYRLWWRSLPSPRNIPFHSRAANYNRTPRSQLTSPECVLCRVTVPQSQSQSLCCRPANRRSRRRRCRC